MTEKTAGFDGEAMRERLNADGPLTLGIEEELMLLHPETLDLAPVAGEVLDRLSADARFKPELAAAQVELLTEPCEGATHALRSLTSARQTLATACSELAVPAGAGAHPFARAPAVLSADPRYEPTRREYGPIAQRQLVFGLHVHVQVSGVDRALAVYNALRSYLPLLAALAANAPFYEGREAGLASVRPKLAELLPRQGVPPPFADFEELVGSLRWGLKSGAMAFPGSWWWELRLHPVYGTLEVRVADQQTRASESAAIATVAHCLVALLAERYDAGEHLPVHPTWRIEQNRWSACRHGADGTFIDLDSGERQNAAEQIGGLLDALSDHAVRLGEAEHLATARELLNCNGARRQLGTGAGGDTNAVCRSLAADFLTG